MKQTIVINGVKYKAVDSKRKRITCCDCDIYKAKIPKSMMSLALCCEEKYIKVNESCCEQLEKGIKRIWKKV